MQQPVTAIANLYPGINAHLHSRWQARHEWNQFHNLYVGALLQELRALLYPLGYRALLESSIQVRRVGDDLPRRPRADILVEDTYPQRRHQPGELLAAPVQPIALYDLLLDAEDDEHPYQAVVIYAESSAVAWIELLSPTNKGSHPGGWRYLAKRQLLLEEGIVFVELDFLHETPPTFPRLPDYSAGEVGAFPYRVAALDPRPTYRESVVYLYQFGVDDPIPMVAIPLNAGDQVTVDLNAVYQQTYTRTLYGYEVDYRLLPEGFERYALSDQARIAGRMAAILALAQRGQPLDPAALAVTPLDLAEALRRIETLRGSVVE